MAVSDEKKLIFIHIPKNGGTSIIKDLGMYDEGHHKWKYYKDKYPNIWDQYKKFAVARNPYYRVISSYEYARMENSYYHSVKGKSIYGKHPDYDLLKNKTFEECVNLLENNPEKLKHHGWELQSNYITNNEGEVMVDEVIYMDNLNKEMKNKIGCEINKVLNQSGDFNLYDYYNDELFNKIRYIYKKDFNILGYD